MSITIKEKVEAILRHLQKTAVARTLDDGKRHIKLVTPSCLNCKLFYNRGGECKGGGHLLYPGCGEWVDEGQ